MMAWPGSLRRWFVRGVSFIVVAVGFWRLSAGRSFLFYLFFFFNFYGTLVDSVLGVLLIVVMNVVLQWLGFEWCLDMSFLFEGFVVGVL